MIRLFLPGFKPGKYPAFHHLNPIILAPHNAGLLGLNPAPYRRDPIILGQW